VQKENSWRGKSRADIWQGEKTCAQDPCACARACWERFADYDDATRAELTYACYNAGSGRSAIARYQQKLNDILRLNPPLATDGVQGSSKRGQESETRRAVKRFQKENGLSQTGALNRKTKEAIDKKWRKDHPGQGDPTDIVPSTPQRINKKIVGTTLVSALKARLMYQYLPHCAEIPCCDAPRGFVLSKDMAGKILSCLKKVDDDFVKAQRRCEGACTQVGGGIDWNAMEECLKQFAHDYVSGNFNYPY